MSGAIPPGVWVSYKHAEGGVWLTERRSPENQVFSHFEIPTKTWRHWHILRLMSIGAALPSRARNTVQAAVTAEQAKFLIANSGVELDHLARLTTSSSTRRGS